MKRVYVFFLVASVILASLIFNFYLYVTNKDQTLTLNGNVDIREVDLGFRVLGRVESMLFEEGDVVKRGDLLSELDKRPFYEEVLESKARLESVRVSLDNTRKLVDRRQGIVESGAVSEEEFEDIRARFQELEAKQKEAEANLSISLTRYQDTEIHSPSDGIILTRIRESGAVVTIGQPVYTLSLFDPVWVRAYVSEPDLGKIYPGQKAVIVTDTNTNPHYVGQIGFISPVAEFTPKTVETRELRTDLVYRLRIVVENPDQGLRQGMPVTVQINPTKQRIQSD